MTVPLAGHAADLGVAMQLVNIMRDVAEDAERDRIYLPADEMAAHGVSEADVLDGLATPGFRSLMRAQGERARDYFARGERLLPMLDRRARMCVSMLSSVSRAMPSSFASPPSFLTRAARPTGFEETI